MPERGFASETWDSDEWFQELSRDQRYLFIYLWTNQHCNQAGLYHITLTTIALEAKFSREELPELLQSLAPKVIWYPDESLIWVKNFIKRQSKSPKFLAAGAKCLTTIRHNGAIQELLEYNLQRYSISIPYQYYIDKLSVEYRYNIDTHARAVSASDTDTVSGKGVGVSKGKGEGSTIGEIIPPRESEIEESLSEGDRKVISVWFSVKGFSMPNEEAAELVARLRTEFSDVDILAESKAWAARKLSEPLKPDSRPSAQIWNWIRKAREFARDKKEVKYGGAHQRRDKEPSAERYRNSLER